MADFRWPPLNEQTAKHLMSLVWRPETRTFADMGIHEIVYIRLFARCSQHGDFSQVFAEDEVISMETQADGMVRLRCVMPDHAAADLTRLCPAHAFATVRNPYRSP